MKKKKILVVTTTDNMIWQFLIFHIKHLEEQGNIVECVCAKTGFFFDELINKYNFVVHQINFSRFPFTIKNIKGYKKLTKLCRDKKYDLIFCHQPVGGVMGRMMGKKFKIPVIYIAHGFHFYKGAPLKNQLIYKTIEKHYSKYTDALVTMNEEDFESAKKFRAKKVYKINGIGVDLKKYENNLKENFDKKSFKNTLGIQKNEIIIVTVAELIKRKNYKTSLKVINKIKDFNIKYLICGRGKLKNKLEKIVKSLKLENKVTFLGFRKDINSILKISDIFLLSTFQEGLPMAIMEAMAYGLPVVCSDVRGCRDLIKHNEGGLLFNPKDVKGFKEGIERLCREKETRKKMGSKNRQNLKNFSIKKVSGQLDCVFKDFLKT